MIQGPEAGHEDRAPTEPLPVRRAVVSVALGAAAYGLFVLLRRQPGHPLQEVVTAPGAAVSSVLGRLSSLSPVPVAELGLLLLLLLWGFTFARALGRTRSGGGGARRALGAGGLRVVSDIGLLAFFFYALWGFGYAAGPLDERLGLDRAPISPHEVRGLAEEMVRAANEEYLRIHGSPDAGVPTSVSSNPGPLAAALDEGWRLAGAELGLDGLRTYRHAPPRTLRLGSPIRHLGVSGIYVPFTGEAFVLHDLPAVALGKALAHETAHQRGVAHESDANFLGYVVASRSPDPLLRYSAYVFAQRQLLNALARTDPEARDALAEERLPGVQRDAIDLRRFWQRVEGMGTRLGTQVNHAYLQQQGIPEGVQSYGGSLTSLVRYARSRGGTLLALDGAAAEVADSSVEEESGRGDAATGGSR